MIFELTCKDPEIKAMLEKRCNIKSDTVYVRGASFSEDLVSWGEPDFGLAAMIEAALMEITDDEEFKSILKATSFEDTRPLMDVVFTEDGELVTFEAALAVLEWKELETRAVLDKEDNPIMMYGLTPKQPIFAFSEATSTGLLFTDNYLIVQDSTNFSKYNMESDRKYLPLKDEMFHKYLVLIKNLFADIKKLKKDSEEG